MELKVGEGEKEEDQKEEEDKEEKEDDTDKDEEEKEEAIGEEEEEEGEVEEEEEEEEEEEVEEEEEERVGVDEPLRERQEEIGPDRISNLPDSLILQILSSLGAEEVGRTSILSKRWQFLWTSVPNLVFYDPNRRAPRFVGRVYRALLLHKPQYMKKFVLDVQYRACNASDVDVWIRFATENQVEELSLRLDRHNVGSDNYQLPQYIFSNASCRKLELSFVKVLPSSSVRWTALKSLSVEYLELTQEIVENILLGSPFLEFLRVGFVFGIDNFESSSNSLKEFVIQNPYPFHPTQSTMVISGPNLLSLLMLGDFYRRFVHIRNVPSLVSADIDCHSFRWRSLVVDYKVLCGHVDEFVGGFRHVKALKLGYWFIQILSSLAFKGLPFIFPPNLKVLTLESPLRVEIVPGLLEMLQSSPYLETLVINRISPNYQEIFHGLELFSGNADEWTPNLRISDSFLQCLRIVKITGFVYPADPTESCVLILVKFLLQNANVLEKMVITAGTPLDRSSSHSSPAFEEVAHKFLNFPRSSPKAVVVFLP